jgi:hypothetical protein
MRGRTMQFFLAAITPIRQPRDFIAEVQHLYRVFLNSELLN